MTALDTRMDSHGAALLAGADGLVAASLALARRFHAGATLWCLAPGAAHHARHVAVEFVHPVIVGKRSLPSFAIDDVDPVAATRLLARPGDVLLAVGAGEDAALAAVLRRGEAWATSTVLLAVGAAPPPPTAADHVVWTGPADGGGLPLAYHLLWELTHVVFEHPGLLVEPVAPACDEDNCITCSDEGRVVEVVEVIDAHTAVVLSAGCREPVDLTVVDEVGPGDLLLVHAGLALTVLERSAQERRP